MTIAQMEPMIYWNKFRNHKNIHLIKEKKKTVEEVQFGMDFFS